MADASSQENRPTQPTQEVTTRVALRTDAITRTPQQTEAANIAKGVVETRVKAEASEPTEFREEILTDPQAGELIKRRFTGERDTTGKLEDKKQRDLEEKTITTDRLIRKVAREGFASLTSPTEKKIITDHIDRMFDLHPELNNLYPKGTPERTAFIEQWLQDPNNVEYFQKLASLEKKALQGQASPEEIEELRNKIDFSEKDREEIVKEQKALTVKLGEADAAITNFDKDPVKGTAAIDVINNTISAGEQEIHVIDTQVAILREEMQMLKDRIDRATNRIYGPGGTPLPSTDVTKDRQRQDDIMREIGEKLSAKTKKEEELKPVRKNKEDIEKERKELTDKKEATGALLEGRATEIEEIDKTIKEFNHDLILKLGGAASLSDNLEETVGLAFKELMEERFRKDNEDTVKAYDEIINQELDKAKKAIETELKNRYFYETTTGLINKRPTVGVNEKQIRRDYGELLTMGPESIMREMLDSQGFSAAEIDAKMQDKSFVDSMRPMVVEQIISLRLRTGQMTKDEATFILKSDWGGKDILDKAQKENKDTDRILGQFAEQGLIEGATMEAVKRADKSTMLAIFLALFGSLGTVAVANARKTLNG